MKLALHTNEQISRKHNVFYKLNWEGYLHVSSDWTIYVLFQTDHLDRPDRILDLLRDPHDHFLCLLDHDPQTDLGRAY